MELTPEEREILASIENDVSAKDPRFARALGRAQMQPVGGRPFPVPARHLVLLVVLLTALAVLGPAVGRFGTTALAALTVLLIAPWMVSASRAAPEPQRRRDGGDGVGTGSEPVD